MPVAQMWLFRRTRVISTRHIHWYATAIVRILILLFGWQCFATMLHNHTTTSLDLQLDITKIASITIHNLLPSMVDLQHERACQQERGDLQAMLWKLDLPLPDDALKFSEFEQSLGVWIRFSRARDGGLAMYLTALHAFVDRASERGPGTQSTVSFLRLPSLELFYLLERPASRLLATVEACLALLLPLDLELTTLEDALMLEWEHAYKLLGVYYSGGEERGTGLKLQETRHEDIPVAEVCILNPLRAGVSESDVFAIHYLINELHRHQLFLRPVLRSYADLRDAVEDILYTAVARLLELSPEVAGRLLMRPRVGEVVSRKGSSFSSSTNP